MMIGAVVVVVIAGTVADVFVIAGTVADVVTNVVADVDDDVVAGLN